MARPHAIRRCTTVSARWRESTGPAGRPHARHECNQPLGPQVREVGLPPPIDAKERADMRQEREL